MMMKRQIARMGSVLAKRMVVLAVVSLGAMAALAIPAHPGLGTVRQPDGTEVRVRLHGDTPRVFSGRDRKQLFL